MRSEFEKTLKQHRDSLIDELVQLGKHRQAQLVEWDIEQNESDYEFYFNAGLSAQQSKVDELQAKLEQAYDDIETFATAHQRECEFKAQFAKENSELKKQLIDQGQRFNEQVQRVRDLEHKNRGLQKQLTERDLRIKRLIESEENIARGCESWRNACSKLWKTEDAVKQLIQVYKDEEKELEIKEWEQSTIYGRIAIELEQALKGGEA